MRLSGSQEAPLTWLPPPVPCLNDGVMYGCQQVLVFFLFFVIGFIFFLRSKTIGAILCKNNIGGGDLLSTRPIQTAAVFRVYHFTCVC